MEHISKLISASSEIRKLPHRSVADTVIIVDENSVMHTYPYVTRLTENLIRNIQLCGTAIDIIFSHDVENTDFSAVSTVFLLTPLLLDDGFVNKLRAKMPNGKIVFCGKTCADTGAVLEDISDGKYPDYRISKKSNVNPLCFNYKGEIIAAKNICGDYILSSYYATVSDIRRILDDAGTHCYAPTECAVYADNRIISFFPRTNMEFVPQLKENTNLTELLSGKKYNVGDTVKIEAKRGIAFIINN